MIPQLILDKNLQKAYEFLDNGILIIGSDFSVIWINKWIRSRLSPEQLRADSFSDLFIGHNFTFLVKKVRDVFRYQNAQFISPVFHSWVIPLSDHKFEDNLMRQHGLITPGKIQIEPDKEPTDCVFIQIKNVSNIVLQIEELESVIGTLKATEKKLENARLEAENANKAKTQFLANMSHEIRTPLNAILGFSQILLNRLKDVELPGESKRDLENIRISGQNLTELIQNILDLSKIESGKHSLHFENLNLKQLFQGIFHINSVSAQEKNIQFSYEFDPSLPKWISSDRTKLNQILMNLTTNAIKFTPEGKTITLKAKKLENRFIFEVSDQGIGISKEKQSVIFNAFEQGDEAHLKEKAGTGLGLAISASMVKALGGEITLDSDTNKGCTFTVNLPLIEAEDDANNANILDLNDFHFPAGSLVMAAEDNPMNQEMLRELFNDLNLELEIVNNGQEAVEKIALIKPDILFLDMHMPVLDGMQAAKQIRTMQEFVDLPIIAMSADAFTNQKENALQSGFNEYITKPVDFYTLLTLLANHLDGTRTTVSDQIQNRISEIPAAVVDQIKDTLQQMLGTPIYYTDKIMKLLVKIKNTYKESSHGQYPDFIDQLEEVALACDEIQMHELISNQLDSL